MNAAAAIGRANGIDMADPSRRKCAGSGTSEQAEKMYNRDEPIAITVWHAAPGESAGRKPLHPATTSVKWLCRQGL
jgi:hypothetical protein